MILLGWGRDAVELKADTMPMDAYGPYHPPCVWRVECGALFVALDFGNETICFVFSGIELRSQIRWRCVSDELK